MSNPSLFYLVGLPGSGKSTYAKRLQDEDKNTVHLSSDLIRKELYNDESCQDNPQRVFELMRTRAITNLKEGKNVIYDATNISRKHRIAFLKSLPKNLSCNKICIIVWAKIETCIKRAFSRDRKVEADVINKMLYSFTTPNFDEGWNSINIELTDSQYRYEDLCSLLSNLAHDNSHHGSDTVLDHITRVEEAVNNLSSNELKKEELITLQNLAKVHDIGKLYTKTFLNSKGYRTEEAHYYQHQNVGAYMILGLNIDNQFSVLTSLQLSYLTLLHMEPFFNNSSNYWKTVNPDVKRILYIFNTCDKQGA